MHGLSSKRFCLLIVVILAAFARCSIKEDRSDCPCILVLDASACPRDTIAFAVEDGEGFAFRDTLRGEDRYTLPVPRVRLALSFCAGWDRCGKVSVTDDGAHVIPYGSPCPHLWLSQGAITASGEAVSYEVTLHKAYCNITLDVHNLPGPPQGLPVVRIYGGVAGYDAAQDPLEGPFSTDALGPVCQVAVPRQIDSSLMMDVTYEGTVRSFALGELLAREGYDWDAPDLQDVDIFIDYASPLLSITFNPYVQTSIKEIVI